jgi:hypothetical protein
MYNDIEFSELLGKTISSIEKSDDELIFHMDNGDEYKQFHGQNCCESVTIEDIVGDLSDLIGSPLLMAEEVIHENKNPEGVTPPEEYQDSFTWTFYKLATFKGYVTIRWYGSSNGYYSESVSLCKLERRG